MDSRTDKLASFAVAKNCSIFKTLELKRQDQVDVKQIASSLGAKAQEFMDKLTSVMNGTAPVVIRPKYNELVARQEQKRRSFHVGASSSAPAFAAILPGDNVAEQVIASGFLNFLTICDPYLNLFRGLIPPLGGTLDFSPILAFVVLNVFTSTAAALPAELPSQDMPSYVQSSSFSFVESSKNEQIWNQLQYGKRQRKMQEAAAVGDSDQ